MMGEDNRNIKIDISKEIREEKMAKTEKRKRGRPKKDTQYNSWGA